MHNMSSQTEEITYCAVQNISLQDTHNLVNKKIVKSYPKFYCEEDKNRQKFYTQIKFGIEADHISVFLQNGSSEDAKIVKCTYELLDNNLKVVKVMFFEDSVLSSSKGLGWHKFHSSEWAKAEKHALLNCQFLLKTTVTFKAIKSAPVKRRNLSQDLLSLYESKKDTDVVFLFTDMSELRAHKNILKARAHYFETLFTSGMAETLSNKIDIKDCSPKVFNELLKYLYSDTPPDCLQEIALELLPIADKYLLEQLVIICEECLMENLDQSCLKDVLIISHRNNRPLLKRRCFKFLDDFTWDFWHKIKDIPDYVEINLDFLNYLGESKYAPGTKKVC